MEFIFLVLLLILLAGALMSGYPVAMALPGSAIVTILIAAGAGWLVTGETNAFFAIGGPSEWLYAGVTNLRGIYWEVERDTLIAIPLFIFMGLMLQQSKVAEDLLVTMAQLFGPVPGGLAISTVFVGALLAATTGILGATVVAMGLIALPAMVRHGYSTSLATGTIAASGTLGQIIPPSIVLIILADQLAGASDQAGNLREAAYRNATGEHSLPSQFAVAPTSASELFIGAFIPGLVLVAIYMAYIFVRALLRPETAPAIPRQEGAVGGVTFLVSVLLALAPPLILIFAVLGSIISGVATVNQAGAVGAAGAIFMAGYRLVKGQRRAYWPLILGLGSVVFLALVVRNFEVNVRAVDSAEQRIGLFLAIFATLAFVLSLFWSIWRVQRTNNALQQVMLETVKSTALVFVILMGAAILTAAFRAFGGEEIVRHFLHSLPGGFWGQLFVVMLVIFVLGFFLEFIEIAVVVVPIVAPILLANPEANATAVWLGVLIGMNAQTSFLTPPFGFALFYLRGVAPRSIKTTEIYRGVVPFIALQLVALVMIAIMPQLVNYLPQRVALTSENAPPPRNPRLASCLIDYVEKEFDQDSMRIQQSIDAVAALDLSSLPERWGDEIGKALTAARASRQKLDTYLSSRDAVKALVPAYDPLRRDVRAIEAQLREFENEKAHIHDAMRRLDVANLEELQDQMDEIKDLQAALETKIPAAWQATNAEFRQAINVQRRALLDFQRTSSEGYSPLFELEAEINAVGSLRAASFEMASTAKIIERTSNADREDLLSELYTSVAQVPGASEIAQSISQARRELRGDLPELSAAQAALASALAATESEIEWRTFAQSDILPVIHEYLSKLTNTVGLWNQPSLTREQGKAIAGCQSESRDISIYF